MEIEKKGGKEPEAVTYRVGVLLQGCVHSGQSWTCLFIHRRAALRQPGLPQTTALLITPEVRAQPPRIRRRLSLVEIRARGARKRPQRQNDAANEDHV